MNTTTTMPLDLDAMNAERIVADDACLCIEREVYVWDNDGESEHRTVIPGEVVWCHPSTVPEAGVFHGVHDKRFHTAVPPKDGLLYRRNFVPLERVLPGAVGSLETGDLLVLNQRASSTEPGPNLVGVLETANVVGGWVRLNLRPTVADSSLRVSTSSDLQEYWLDPEFSVTSVWRVRRRRVTEPDTEVTTPDPEVITEVPDVESIRAEVQALKQQIGELTDRNTNLSSELSAARGKHISDIEKIGDALLHEAERREWCSDFDDLVTELNRTLDVPLERRTREVDVEFDVTGSTTITMFDRGLRAEVPISWTTRVTRSMTCVGDPSEYDFTDDVDVDDLLSDISYEDVSILDTSVYEFSIENPRDLWDAVAEEASMYDVEVEVYDYS